MEELSIDEESNFEESEPASPKAPPQKLKLSQLVTKEAVAAPKEFLDDGDAWGDDGEINTDSFSELKLPNELIMAAKDAWNTFVSSAESREAAGEAIYTALFEGAPSLQSLFTTPRAVQAMRFMNGLASFVEALSDGAKLKILVESLGFGHLHLDVTVPRVVIFRDAILDLFHIELGDKFSSQCQLGWTSLLNYIGGAIIYVKAHYADRIACLLRSWKICTTDAEEVKAQAAKALESDSQEVAATVFKEVKKKNNSKWPSFGRRASAVEEEIVVGSGAAGSSSEEKKTNGFQVQNVPTTYPDMFLFNAAVMGFGQSVWMREVLACFHDIVVNVSNAARLSQECSILSLRISKKAAGQVNLAEYKSCMLASLRSLLPQDWDSNHEVAWTWLWDNVERLILSTHGKPPEWEKALGKFLDSLDEDQKFEIRADIYATFFAMAPTGQDYFKQSNTYLHFIAERIIQMTLELFKDPTKMVDDVSALGLRHVGYAIPTEMFGPFVTSCIEVVKGVAPDQKTVEAFRFALGLVSQMLTRTITEGSTIVMKAINANNQNRVRKAVGCAPRGERAQWMLLVQVGTQRISPLSWSLQNGSLEATQAIFKDLSTIRADRENYYYGLDELFKMHPDMINRVCKEAPGLLPVLLDGMIWRSRSTDSGSRRVNYYIKHLLIDEEGKPAHTLKWITDLQDPKIVCHPVVVLVSDLMWKRIVLPTFLYGKTWFLFTLILFIISQSVLKYLNNGRKGDTERIVAFICRSFIYLCSMNQLIYIHARDSFKAFRAGDVFQLLCFWVPVYLKKWQDAASFFLAVSLMIMFCLEPIARCWKGSAHLFDADCADSSGLVGAYEFCSMSSMFLYYVLLIDFAAVQTTVAAFVLLCIRMLSEATMFLGAVCAVTLTFSSAISVIKHDDANFGGVLEAFYSCLRMWTRTAEVKMYENLEDEPVVIIVVFVFLVTASLFMVSLFVAQLTCGYSNVYHDMFGYARLERGMIIVALMPNVPEKRWRKVFDAMRFSKRIEFNPGDVGIAGGIQLKEPAGDNPTTVDMIRRYGGSTSKDMPWPAEEEENSEGDRFERIEKLIQKALKNLATKEGGGGGTSGGESGEQSASGGGTKQSSSSSAGGEQAMV